MAKEVIMPALGMAQEVGILVRWLKQPGDMIKKGEPLMEVETDKATVEVEANGSGVLANVTAAEGDEIPVGQVIALILAPGEEAPEQSPTLVEPVSAASAVKERPQKEQNGRSATPLAKRIADEHGIDLNDVTAAGDRIVKADVLSHIEVLDGNGSERVSSTPRHSPASPKARRLALASNLLIENITGSGPDGAVLTADIQIALARPPEVTGVVTERLEDGHLQRPSKVWRIMADRLSQSWTTVPHFYLVRDVNASRLIDWRSIVNEQAIEKVTFTDLLVKLTALNLKLHRQVNGSWSDGYIMLYESINVGLAVATDSGLVVPVIHEADQLSLTEIATRRREVVSRAQEGKLKLDDLQDGTFTISNLGMYGIDAFNAIVNPPQAAILAVGRIAERVVPVDGVPAVHPMMTLTLSCDHRVVDGARGAEFLRSLVNTIEEPMRIID